MVLKHLELGSIDIHSLTLDGDVGNQIAIIITRVLQEQFEG